jgi:hypothetical protein
MAVAGWLLLGAIAGVVLNRLADEGARSRPITVMGAMTGAYWAGRSRLRRSASPRSATKPSFAFVLLAAAAAVRIAIEEGRLGE